MWERIKVKFLTGVSSLHMDARNLVHLLYFKKKILGGKWGKPDRQVGN